MAAELSGVSTGKFSRDLEGWGRVFGVKFKPGGFRTFLGAATSTITDTVQPAQNLLGLAVDQLAARAGMSVRSLQRLFREYVGVPPKWVIRRYRLHELVERLHSGQSFDGAQLALDLGYADQAHLINDFRNLVGYTPTGYSKLATTHPSPQKSAARKTSDQVFVFKGCGFSTL